MWHSTALFSGTIFSANHLTGAKTWFKPNQTATKLQHKDLKQQLHKKPITFRQKCNENKGWFRCPFTPSGPETDRVYATTIGGRMGNLSLAVNILRKLI